MKHDLKAIAERAEKAQQELFALCKGKKFVMSIPPMKDDTDMLIGDSLHDIPSLLEYIEKLEAVVNITREARAQDKLIREMLLESIKTGINAEQISSKIAQESKKLATIEIMIDMAITKMDGDQIGT
jgi:hypothetical protein